MSDRMSLLAGVLGASLSLGSLGVAAGESLVDPTRPDGWRPGGGSVEEADAPPAVVLTLQGVFDAAGRRSAVINGRRVSVGDEVDGAEVVAIERQLVVVSIDGKDRELVLELPPVKAPAAAGNVDTRLTQEAKRLVR